MHHRLFYNPCTNKMLGRWSLHYDKVTVNIKIDQANEDHCGCCVVPMKMMVPLPPKLSDVACLMHDVSNEEYFVPYVTSSFY